MQFSESAKTTSNTRRTKVGIITSMATWPRLTKLPTLCVFDDQLTILANDRKFSNYTYETEISLVLNRPECNELKVCTVRWRENTVNITGKISKP